jgi:hypothetical protein
VTESKGTGGGDACYCFWCGAGLKVCLFFLFFFSCYSRRIIIAIDAYGTRVSFFSFPSPFDCMMVASSKK